jgi:hypothetical protein
LNYFFLSWDVVFYDFLFLLYALLIRTPLLWGSSVTMAIAQSKYPEGLEVAFTRTSKASGPRCNGLWMSRSRRDKDIFLKPA